MAGVRFEHVVVAVGLALLVAFWAWATGRRGLFRFIVGTLMFGIASLISLLTIGLAYLGARGGGAALLFAVLFVPVGALASFFLWSRFFAGLRSGPAPEPKPLSEEERRAQALAMGALAGASPFWALLLSLIRKDPGSKEGTGTRR